MRRVFFRTKIIFFLSVFCSVCCGVFLGATAARTLNVKNTENFFEFEVALPSRLYDISGELVTEFASDEKRELITIDRLPQHLIDALVCREDQNFFRHRGFSLKAIVRAVYGILRHERRGGGSTLTQQIAGTLYCDRNEKTALRKIKELWWAVQMERRYSKAEILEIYLNKIYFGSGTYGVSAASKYYFGHSAEEITPAEAAILVVQLSSPAEFNPFEHPNAAKERQQMVLQKMAELSYISEGEAQKSFDEYWSGFDYTRRDTGAFFTREDRAPWFSEYARRELSQMLYGKADIYTGGFSINTTLNLKHQAAAEKIMAERIDYANKVYKKSSGRSTGSAKEYIPVVEMLSLLFDLPQLKFASSRADNRVFENFYENINPVLDVASLVAGLDGLKGEVVNKSNENRQSEAGKTLVEGTLVSIEPETGYITALVGGSKFDSENQFIRATQAKVQPGSTFKPLYYSAAIDSRKYTAASMIYDSPIVFYADDGKPYTPTNHNGTWQGSVQLWYALAKSMNVPSVQIFAGIGRDAAIGRAVSLLGIPQGELEERALTSSSYTLALGTASVRPIEIARAYAVFANQGREVEPIAIRNVRDRNGKIVLDPEREILERQRQKGERLQVVSPQNAYIMTDILLNSTRMGTLASSTGGGEKLHYFDGNGKRRIVSIAGKTGTTQNWTNAWAVAYTPNLSAAIWFGFDKPGETLGTQLTGATLAGPALGEFMRAANEDYPQRNFAKPATGLVRLAVCSSSGQLPSPACGKSVTYQYFLPGTQPSEVCSLHQNRQEARAAGIERLESESAFASFGEVEDEGELVLDLSFLDDDVKKALGGDENSEKSAIDDFFDSDEENAVEEGELKLDIEFESDFAPAPAQEENPPLQEDEPQEAAPEAEGGEDGAGRGDENPSLPQEEGGGIAPPPQEE